MALRGHLTATISQLASSGDTCFGLPGQGGDAAVLCDVSLTVHVAVYDTNVYVGLNGSVNRNDIIVPATYPVRMCVSPTNWNWTWDGTSLIGPSGAFNDAIAVTADSGSTLGDFAWNFTCGDPSETEPAGTGYVLVGTLNQFHGSDTGTDGYLYLGGTGNYDVDDPVYPTPVRIGVPGFKAFLDYFPWASYSGSTWQSCNRTGGFVQSYSNNAWTNQKNSTDGTGTVYYYDGSNWVICPLIGEV